MNRTRWRYDNDDSKNNTGIIEVINRGKHTRRSLSDTVFLSVAGVKTNSQRSAALKYSCVSLSSLPYVNEPGEPQGWRAPRWPGEVANFCWTEMTKLEDTMTSEVSYHLKGSEHSLTLRLEDPLYCVIIWTENYMRNTSWNKAKIDTNSFQLVRLVFDIYGILWNVWKQKKNATK